MPDSSQPTEHRWTSATLRNPHDQPDKAQRVEAMFDAIAPTYERVNAVSTFGLDTRWRRRAVQAADVSPGDVALDVCCGTGDMIRAFASLPTPPTRIIGVDFAARMLELGRYDDIQTPVHLIRADALHLPLADESVDVISCAFGVRNFADLDAGLREMHRVARPGARVVILEFALPDNPVVRWGYRIYCDRILPLIGSAISRDRIGAYRYLPSSIRTFGRARDMVDQLTAAGFGDVTARGMNLGGVVLYRALRAPVSS